VPLEIRWQGGLEFDGRTIVLRHNILARGPDDALRCDELSARLTSDVQFGKRVDQNAVDLAEVECRGHVVIDHTSRDAEGITSHERAELARISVNQQTGAIGGDGPGVIRSTHFSEQLAGLANPASRVVLDPEVSTITRGGGPPGSLRNTRLQFLRVDFQDRLAGNLFTRELSFFTRVRTMYGPVDAWEQELNADRPELLPPETLILTSDELGINEDPLAVRNRPRQLAQIAGQPFGPVQFRASGNVRIEGQSPAQGAFTATAHRVSYEQGKELLILEGTDRAPATLWHRERLGGQQIENAARKIQYNRVSGKIEQDGVQRLEFVPEGGGRPWPQNATGPAPVRQ
jgi:hypothetical protein